MNSATRYRSFVWPALFILAGVLALLVNTGRISVDRLYQLADLWPVILIVIGLELILHRTLTGWPAELAAALVVLLAIVGAVAYVAVAPNREATHTIDASEAVGTLDHASLEIDAGAATVSISGGGSLDGDLYRAHLEYSGPKPEVALDRGSGQLRITQSSANFGLFQSQRFVLNLSLNSRVTWAITSNSGASTNTLNLNGLQVGSIELNTGASKDEITLGAPAGVVPVTINGGALTVGIHRPSGTEASVVVAGGAVSLNADGKQTHGIGHASYDSPGLGGAMDAYRIEVAGGACTVTLDQVAS